MGKSKVSFLIQVEICIEKDDDGYYAFCPSLKGVHTCGNTEKEALENAKNAIAAYIVSLIKHKEPLPFCQIVREEKEEPCSTGKLFSEVIEIPELA
jgi:predicted RNase H-like HicB family nuclease